MSDERYREAAEIRYTPQGAVRALFERKDPEVLLEGPAGTGKTRGALEYVDAMSEKYPGIRVLIARDTRTSMTESVLVTLEEKVWGGYHPAMFGGAVRANRSSYRYPYAENVVDGQVYRGESHWTIGGLDNPDRIMSTEYDLVVVFEATEVAADQWEKLCSRLRNYRMPYQQMIADCNPVHPGHFLNQRAARGQMVRLLSRHKDNPSLRPEYLERLSNLTGARRGRLYEGKWVAQEGAVYELWDERENMCYWAQLPTKGGQLDFRYYWASFDAGYTAPACFQVWACDWDGTPYMLHEVYYSRKGADWWAAQIESFCKMYPLQTIECEHEPEFIDKLNDMLGKYRQRDAKALVTRATKDVAPGIEVVRTFMQKRSNGTRGLYLVRGALVEADQKLIQEAQPYATYQEIPSYHYPVLEEGQINRDEPAKGQPDHGCDAMRYALMWLWRKNMVLLPKKSTFDVGSWADILGHDDFLKKLARRDRRRGA